MNIGAAISALKSGKKVRRLGWNGKGMYLYLITISACGITASHVNIHPVSGGDIPWTCSQADLMANDWELVK